MYAKQLRDGRVEATGLLLYSNKDSASPFHGTATLIGGTISVDTTAIQAESVVILTHQTAAGTIGVLSVGTRTAGTSFIINSSNVLDVSLVAWLIIN